MAKQDTKLNISDITFDDFIGDGLEAASSNENSANELENDQDLNEEDEYEEDEFENSEDQDDQEEEDDDDSEDSRKFKRVEDLIGLKIRMMTLMTMTLMKSLMDPLQIQLQKHLGMS